MRWNKNPASYAAWAIIFILSVCGLVGSAFYIAEEKSLSFVARILIPVICAAVGFLAVFLLSKIRKIRKEITERRGLYWILTLVCFCGCIALAFWLKLQYVGNEEAASPFYTYAKVLYGQRVPRFVHGALNFYMQFLHQIYFFFGNSVENGIYIQIILYCIIAGLLALASGVINGKFCTCVSLALLLFLPGIGDDALTLTPSLLYMTVWSLVFLLISIFSGKRLPIVSAGVLGLLVGSLIYFDISGVVLLFVLPIFYFSRKTKESTNSSLAIACGLSCLSAIISFSGCVFTDALYSGKGFVDILFAWLRVINPVLPSLSIDAGSFLVGNGSVVLFVILVLGCFDFWFHRERECLKGWILPIVMILLGSCFGIFSRMVPGRMFIAAFVYLLAAAMLKQLFFKDAAFVVVPKEVKEDDAQKTPKKPKQRKIKEKKEKPKREKKTKEKKKPQTTASDSKKELPGTAVKQDDVQSEGTEAEHYQKSEEFSDMDIQFLENPLPLPKKHVRKAADFDHVSVDPEDDYDYEVADDDDYDVP